MFKRISLAGYSLNEDKSNLPDELDISQAMTLTLYFDAIPQELLDSVKGVPASDETPQGQYALDIFENFVYQVSYKAGNGDEPIIVSKGKWFNVGAAIGKESDIIEITEYEYYDFASQSLVKADKAKVLGEINDNAPYFIITSASGCTIKFMFDYQGGNGDVIPITVNIKNLPVETDDTVLLNVCTLLVDEDGYDELLSIFANTYESDKNKITELVDLLYNNSVCCPIGRYSPGNGVEVTQKDNGLEATVDAVYYVDKIFNKNIGDDVGLLTLIYYGKP
ncbi:MAG: hypothetical protein IKN54_00360, partial [Lachnospiraceae bacterium]|nr:hypothetical protein [Lachnospiraceae bacterium]